MIHWVVRIIVADYPGTPYPLPMVSAVIVAAGKGTRMGPNVDKLFLEIHGCPVVGHTWKRFDAHPHIAEVVLVVRGGMQPAFHDLAAQLKVSKPYKLVPGGKERQDSVWNGLEAVAAGCDVVAIQDGARPVTSEALITKTILAARQTGAAVAAQAVTDTIKESADGKVALRTLDRSRLWAVQTPQTFKLGVIREALSEVRRKGLAVTDDTAACELTGHPVQLVPESAPNPKVTRPEDLPWIEFLVSRG